MPGVSHHQGNRNLSGYARAWSAAHQGQECSNFTAFAMAHKGKASSDVSFNPDDPTEAYTNSSAYEKITEYTAAARSIHGPKYDPRTDNIDANTVMRIGQGKKHGRYWIGDSVIDTASTPTLSQIRAQSTIASSLPAIRSRPATTQHRVDTLQAQVEEANRRAQELELGLAVERDVREADKLAQEKRLVDIIAWMQTTTGAAMPPRLMGPPQPPHSATLPQSAGSNNPAQGTPNEQMFPSPSSAGWPHQGPLQ
ncbi:uncharacterized protein [Miscanthus floridulus]|uniref:uncharacterized protein n=1 Tax=Miscanthus floridulus TaxID=154761 RepID=UPI00345AC100